MIQNISKPFKWFFKLEASSGLVLLFAAVMALIISNSNLAEVYFSTLNKYIFLGINNFNANNEELDVNLEYEADFTYPSKIFISTKELELIVLVKNIWKS